jgi:hypothetical protein
MARLKVAVKVAGDGLEPFAIVDAKAPCGLTDTVTVGRGRLVPGRCREGQARSVPLLGVVDPDPAALVLDDPAGDRRPRARPGCSSRSRRLPVSTTRSR